MFLHGRHGAHAPTAAARAAPRGSLGLVLAAVGTAMFLVDLDFFAQGRINAIRIHLSDVDCVDPARAFPYPAQRGGGGSGRYAAAGALRRTWIA